jgi:hypothetical protein
VGISNSKKVSRVMGSSKPNPFPGKSKVTPKSGANYPKQIGIKPIVKRADAMTPILPKGMAAPGIIDESAGGDRYKF